MGEQLDSLRNTETKNKHEFEQLSQSIEDEIKYGNEDMARAKKNLAESTETLASENGDLEVTNKALAEDTATAETVKQDCMTAAEDHEAETKSRNEELKAI